MKHYSSQFSASDTEYLYQQIEELKGYLSSEALFLIEEKDEEVGSRIIFKVKDNDILFQVDSSAPNLLEAVSAAKDQLILLICHKRQHVYEQPKSLFN